MFLSALSSYQRRCYQYRCYQHFYLLFMNRCLMTAAAKTSNCEMMEILAVTYLH